MLQLLLLLLHSPLEDADAGQRMLVPKKSSRDDDSASFHRPPRHSPSQQSQAVMVHNTSWTSCCFLLCLMNKMVGPTPTTDNRSTILIKPQDESPPSKNRFGETFLKRP
jgi:hypothetical protein